MPVPRRRPLDRVRRTCPSATRPAADVSLPSLEEVSLPEHGGPVDVLHGVSFRVEPGQLVALVGHSGAGKSTIANLVPRLYDVTGGAVRVGGVDVRTATLDSLRDAIGVVTQDAHLFHDTHPGQPALRPAGGDRGRALGGAGGRADRDAGPRRCPRGWTPSSATAATGCPAARSSGSRSPGCCSRRRAS